MPSLVNVTVADTPYGSPVEILVQAGVGQTGSVKIEVNGNTYMAELDNTGKATFHISGLNVNEYTVSVNYAGDHSHSPIVNSTKFNVTKVDLTVDIGALDVTVENNPTFIINSINIDFAGKMTITIGDVKYDDVVKTIIQIGKLPAGDYTATVKFYDDNNYKDKTLDVGFTVSRVTPTISVTIDDVTYPDKAVAQMTVGNKANGTVKITVGTQEFTGSVSNGIGQPI